jgi:ribonuclease HII
MSHLVCGVDEAGRGPIAGPVFAAAVILAEDFDLTGIDDSKRLSEKRREFQAVRIKSGAIAWSVAQASVSEVDDLNILQATFLAMRRAVTLLTPAATEALIDGNLLPGLFIPEKAIIGGDAIVPAISAASILAKTARDAYMRELHEKYPGYGFDRHKGYDTQLHRRTLDELGPCEEHRVTFATVRNCQKQRG